MAGRPGKLTEDLAKHILANLRQSGRLIDAAAREGISKSTLFAWLKRGNRESSGAYHSFSRAVLTVGEERIASLAFRHHRLATGCVMEMPTHHKSSRMRGAAKGGQVISRVALRPNRTAMEWELRRLDPDTYEVKKEPSSDAVARRGRRKRPRGVLPREPIGELLEPMMTVDEIDSGQSHKGDRGRRCKLTPEMSARILGYYRQSGNLKNAALRAGISKSTLFDWLQRGKQDDSEPYRAFLTISSSRAQSGWQCWQSAIARRPWEEWSSYHYWTGLAASSTTRRASPALCRCSCGQIVTLWSGSSSVWIRRPIAGIPDLKGNLPLRLKGHFAPDYTLHFLETALMLAARTFARPELRTACYPIRTQIFLRGPV
jgi:hypothetical protein